jgi:hypothetical protein
MARKRVGLDVTNSPHVTFWRSFVARLTPELEFTRPWLLGLSRTHMRRRSPHAGDFLPSAAGPSGVARQIEAGAVAGECDPGCR